MAEREAFTVQVNVKFSPNQFAELNRKTRPKERSRFIRDATMDKLNDDDYALNRVLNKIKTVLREENEHNGGKR